jgi:subtilisin family serine protease
MFRRAAVLIGLVAAAFGLGSAQAEPGTGNYIVVLKDGRSSPAQVAAQHEKAHGFTAEHVYSHALRGYAATLPQAALVGITSRPEVEFVSEDGELQAMQVEMPEQVVSIGVRRIDGDKSSTRSGDGRGTVNVNVAVIDDGPIDAAHPDLNVVGSRSCLSRSDPISNPKPPGGFHSTMVAGFIGARDNGFGRVGIAPGARIWAVEALDNNGYGRDSELICAIDWVTSTRRDGDPSNDIAVANMSLGGQLPASAPTGACGSGDDARLTAICGAVAAGVTLVAAAGNEAVDFQRVWPATLDVVLTASAMADFDGEQGGLQPPSAGCVESAGPNVDDTAAWFSNFATLPDDRVHTVAAPGVCIGSTFPGGLYAISSGTSFATPLVAGTVALCVASGPCAGLTPRQIIQKMVGDATSYNTTKKNSSYGFDGDPLRPISGKYYGYLIRAAQY